MNDFTPYQTDYLFLLVGTNPLPNYVATLLLAKDNGTIYLLHSAGSHGTGEIAKRLDAAIKKKRPQVQITLHEIDESNGTLIFQKVSDLARDFPHNASVGLHYTGGTKAMAVHTYRAIEKTFPNMVFSYLDARTLSLIVETGTKTKQLLVDDRVTVDLKEMLSLHGYEAARRPTPTFYPEFYQALAQVHSDTEAFEQWRKWVEDTQWQGLPDPDTATFSLLREMRQAFDDLCGKPATPELVAQKLGCKEGKLTSCSKWFLAEWLEDYVLWALSQVATEAGIHDYCIGLKPRAGRQFEFEIDVAAVKGYQLFAISCAASNNKNYCKGHLLEVYVRACQIGGDEARIGLVSFYRDPAALKQEIEEAWFTEGRVKVFNAQDLLDGERLQGSLKNWFESVNR